MRRALATLSALTLPLALTARGASIPGLPGSGSGFGAALNRLEIGSRDQILTVGYADVARVRELFGDYQAGPATDPAQRNARDAWLMSLTGAPQAIQMPSPRSPLAQSEGSYFTHATASVRAYGGTKSNSSWTAGGAGVTGRRCPHGHRRDAGSATSATAVHCVRAADGTDPNTLADQLRGRQGQDYTATNVSVSGQVVKVELTPTKDPLESAKGTILGMPERVFPVF